MIRTYFKPSSKYLCFVWGKEVPPPTRCFYSLSARPDYQVRRALLARTQICGQQRTGQPFKAPKRSNRGQDGTNPRLICKPDRPAGYTAPQQKPSATGGLPPVSPSSSHLTPELPNAPTGPFVGQARYCCCPRANELLGVPAPIHRQVIQPSSLCKATLSHRPLVQ